MLPAQRHAETKDDVSTYERLTRLEDSLLLLCANIELAILKPRTEAKPKPRGEDQGQEPTHSELPPRGARESIPPSPDTSQPFGDTGGANAHSGQTPAPLSERVGGGAMIGQRGDAGSFAAEGMVPRRWPYSSTGNGFDVSMCCFDGGTVALRATSLWFPNNSSLGKHVDTAVDYVCNTRSV